MSNDEPDFDRSRADVVASDVPYRIQEVAGHPPVTLADFAGDRVTVRLITPGTGDVVEVIGSARLLDREVILYEKDRGGMGKDVRTWSIRSTKEGFVATERSMF